MAIGMDTVRVLLTVAVFPPQSDGRTMLSPTSKEG